MRLLTLLAVINAVSFFAQCAMPLTAQAQEIESLPKVVLVGDSIRLSYAPIVAAQLKGTAVVVSPKSNGGDSSNVLKNLNQWVISEKPDVVHFNCGIHDTKKFMATGKFQVSPEEYEANLRAIVQRIREETGATVIFATTTSIINVRAAEARKGRDYQLLNESVVQYNTIALKVMADLKVPVNDLYAKLAKPYSPHTTDSLIGSDGVHLTDSGKEMLGKGVATDISRTISRLADRQ